MARPYIGGTSKAVKTITSDTTLYKSDHGVTCLINHNAASTVTINLPAKQAGLEIKVLFIAAMDDASAAVHIKAPNANDMVGSVATVAADLTGVQKTAGSVNQLQITDNIRTGSFFNFISDGSKWYVNGLAFSDSTDRVDFAAV